MMIVGLTGGIGSGKSAAAALFAELGVPVVDTDAIAHALTAAGQPALSQIIQTFGPQALLADGTLNRPYLRRRIFAEPAAKNTLEGILHPLIRAEVQAQLQRNAHAPYQLVMVPLLFETGAYAELIARSLVIDCDEALQVSRAMTRSGLSEDEARAIIAAQCARAQRLAQADDVIVNDGTLDELAQRVREKHEKYIRLA